jgi:hypothetical protein
MFFQIWLVYITVYVDPAILEYHACCDDRKISKLRVFNAGDEFESPPLRHAVMVFLFLPCSALTY